MRVWVLFLIGLFVLSGTSLGDLGRRRPSLLLMGCAVVSACYLSYRFVR
ncbi:MAG: hypothetical protein WA964_17535 [Ilumatobacter sp.]